MNPTGEHRRAHDVLHAVGAQCSQEQWPDAFHDRICEAIAEAIDAARREALREAAGMCRDRAHRRSAESTADDAVTQVLGLEDELCAVAIEALEDQ